MPSELFKKLSEELKLFRGQKEITLQQISNKTKINIKFLEAIEEGNFDIIDEVYIRAFLREYAQMIEIDETEVIEKYEKCRAGEAAELEKAFQEEIENKNKVAAAKEKEQKAPAKKKEGRQKKTSKKKEDIGKKLQAKKVSLNQQNNNQKSKLNDEILKDTNSKSPISQFSGLINDIKSIKGNTALLAILGVAILIAFIIIYFVFIKESKHEIVAERPYEEQIQEKSEQLEDEPYIEQTAPPAGIDSLSLTITASDTSWVRVVIDEFIIEEFILLPSINRTLKAETDFDILVGNSGGIDLFLNGESLNFIGTSGGVRNIIVDKNGYRPATIREPAQNE
ncbi:helix-turn-helix domain-containing protein [Bacteroidota bacterium]